MNIEKLNKSFGIKNQLEFVEGAGGLVNVLINNQFATARVSLYAAQVLSFRPASAQDDLMFLSEHAYFQPGKAIKGGVPVCWPWFGPDPQGKGRPTHGFARTSVWDVLETSSLKSGATSLVLGLKLNDATRALWQGDIEARLEIEIGETLKLRLVTINPGYDAIELTQALHTYFNVGDIAKTSVHGLENKTYIDKVDGGSEKVQTGKVTVNDEVDRIYMDVNNDLHIHDTQLNRKIHIHSEGSSSAVVWNPWKKLAAAMPDLGDEDYRRMICVETTNAGPDVITVPGGQRYTIAAEYQIENG